MNSPLPALVVNDYVFVRRMLMACLPGLLGMLFLARVALVLARVR